MTASEASLVREVGEAPRSLVNILERTKLFCPCWSPTILFEGVLSEDLIMEDYHSAAYSQVCTPMVSEVVGKHGPGESGRIIEGKI